MSKLIVLATYDRHFLVVMHTCCTSEMGLAAIILIAFAFL
jgi:hypothetical protein